MTKIFFIFIGLIAFVNLADAAEINGKDAYGNSSIHRADNLESIKKLLSEGADINAQGGDKFTPLHIAVKNNNLGIVKELLARKADVSLVDSYGRTPLFYAQSGEIAKALISQKADPNNSDKWKTSALERAARRCYADVAKILIENGADVKAVDSWGCSPIHKAAICGDVEIAELILKKGADINAKCDGGRSPLFYAAGFANVKMVKFLLKNKADIFAKTDAGKTIIQIAKNDDEGLIRPITMNSDSEIVEARKKVVELLEVEMKK
jgi:ankyrin repeat protein